MKLLKKIILRISVFLPSPIKIIFYRLFCHYSIGKNVKIGRSFIKVDKCQIGDNVIIGNRNKFYNIPDLQIGSFTTIGDDNIFTSSPEFSSPQSKTIRNNNPKLIIGTNCGISYNNYFDIQDEFLINDFTVIAGVYSVFFTHYLDIKEGKQAAKPIHIGKYCMLGARVSLVPGAIVPNYCVIGMGAVITKPFHESYCLIGGNPADIIKRLEPESLFFKRNAGFISSVSKSPFDSIK